MMIGCDVCDNWYHTACLATFLGVQPAGEEDLFVCPLCVESKADAFRRTSPRQPRSGLYGGHEARGAHLRVVCSPVPFVRHFQAAACLVRVRSPARRSLSGRGCLASRTIRWM